MTAALVDPAKVIDLGIVSRESRVTPGFTAIWIIVISAIGYSVRIAIDPSSGNHLLTATFLAANVVGWLLGAWLRSRDAGSTLGFLLVLLGDAIFPLNLFAPLLLFVPGLRGNTPLTATAVIVVGITYHLYNYWNRASARFALPFYPYFFATICCAGLVLLQYTAGLPLRGVAWLVLLFAVGFNEISHRLRPEPAVHFAIASAAILTASILLSALAFQDRNAAALAAMIAATSVLIFSAIRERADEAMGRSHGMAAWLGVTLTFTALLYLVHSPWWVYLVATGAWTLILAVVSTRQGDGWSEPFPESAWWAAMTLAAALAVSLWQVWTPFIVRALTARPPREAATTAFFEAGLALLIVSVWRRRYPPIAATLPGFVTNNVLLRLTSYAAPLFLVIAAAGAWQSAHGPAPASVYALLAAGTLLLIAGPRAERHYPVEALDFAGVLAMVFSAFNGLGSAMLSAAVLFGAAAIFLARYLRDKHRWTFGAFLILTAGGVALQTIGSRQSTIVFLLAAAAVAWASSQAQGTLARVGFWAAHASAFLFWLSFARALGAGAPYDAVLLAGWAWFAMIAWRASRGLGSKTSLHVCFVLATAALAMLFVRPADPQVLTVTLLLLGTLFFELPKVSSFGYLFLAAAAFVAANRTEGVWLASTFAVCAAVLLIRSLARRSSFAHLLFLAAAIACAVLLMPVRGDLQTLPIAILVAILCLVELAGQKESGSFRADVTSVAALVLGVGIVAAEAVSTRYSIYSLAVLVAAAFAIRGWIAVSAKSRLWISAHTAFFTLGIVAAAVAVASISRLGGLRAGQQLFAYAACGWLLLPWLARSRSRIAALAMHIIAVSVYAMAFVLRGSDPFVIAACVATAGAYLILRAAWKQTALEHLSAAGLIEAVCLWGFAQHLAWPELYLLAGSAYLCIVLLRRTAPRGENAIALVLIAAAVAFPYYALLRTGAVEHLAFLAIAGIVVIHVLLASRRHVLMVVTVCAMLGLGMMAGAALHDDVRLNLWMALAGFIVIADLGLIGFRGDRRSVMGEIDYDDNRVTR